MAEIELKSKDQDFEKPNWIGDEVSYDKRYYNHYLSKNLLNYGSFNSE